ncbi:hypothetical protein [Streptomyces sp. NBC_01794]|uniref:hypothetical protein n=1 Tax=Streptomyces sp. NBC_01794 TaxID=2975942 RepID=UPI0030876B12|nr:hypothetical protein OIE54_09645 [Streptomyces sp. NBC_01794]
MQRPLLVGVLRPYLDGYTPPKPDAEPPKGAEDNEEWRILDAFEDVRYDLREVTLSNGQTGWAYVWPGGDVRTDDWDAAEFEERHLAEYVARCVRLAPGLAAESRRASDRRHPAGRWPRSDAAPVLT